VVFGMDVDMIVIFEGGIQDGLRHRAAAPHICERGIFCTHSM
jgi:hypothetical protein